LALTLALRATPAGAAGDPASERVQSLVALAMQAYWTGGDSKAAEALLKGVTLHGRYDVVERAFSEASALAPSRLDLRFAVASTQLLQKNLAAARATYAKILAQDPASFEAYAWLAALDRAEQDDAGAAGAEQAMAALDPQRAATLRRRFDRVERIVAEPLDPNVRSLPGGVAVVTLGYALNPAGGMEKPLLDRLAATLAAARANPSARIVVTGGQPQAGVTEADLMTRWLVEHGVDRDRVQIEDKAKDTVGNALNAAGLLARARPDTVLLVTSASHMRRARVLMEAALQQAGLDAEVVPLVAVGGATGELAAPASVDERLAIYRDTLRVSGLWAYPGLQP
jgi:tetratricopeptide (TPR) repeat protein